MNMVVAAWTKPMQAQTRSNPIMGRDSLKVLPLGEKLLAILATGKEKISFLKEFCTPFPAFPDHTPVECYASKNIWTARIDLDWEREDTKLDV